MLLATLANFKHNTLTCRQDSSLWQRGKAIQSVKCSASTSNTRSYAICCTYSTCWWNVATLAQTSLPSLPMHLLEDGKYIRLIYYKVMYNPPLPQRNKPHLSSCTSRASNTKYLQDHANEVLINDMERLANHTQLGKKHSILCLTEWEKRSSILETWNETKDFWILRGGGGSTSEYMFQLIISIN